METVHIFRNIQQFGSVDFAEVINGVVSAIEDGNKMQIDNTLAHQHLLDTLYRFLCFFNSTKSEMLDEKLGKIASSILRTVCMPSFKKVSSPKFQNSDGHDILSKNYALLKLCLKTADGQSCLEALQLALRSTKCFISSVSDGDADMPDSIVDVHCALEILNCFASNISCEKIYTICEDRNLSEVFIKSWESMHPLCLSLLSVLEAKQSQNLLISVLLKMLEISDDQSARLATLWHEIKKIHEVDRTGYLSYTILCCLSNLYFPLSGVVEGLDLTSSDEFWHIIQTGLPQENPLIRKQCLYLLKRIVDTCEKTNVDTSQCGSDICCSLFRWKTSEKKQLVRVWEDFIMLFETLEEKQVSIAYMVQN